jgi:hypothetical protein
MFAVGLPTDHTQIHLSSLRTARMTRAVFFGATCPEAQATPLSSATAASTRSAIR